MSFPFSLNPNPHLFSFLLTTALLLSPSLLSLPSSINHSFLSLCLLAYSSSLCHNGLLRLNALYLALVFYRFSIILPQQTISFYLLSRSTFLYFVFICYTLGVFPYRFSIPLPLQTIPFQTFTCSPFLCFLYHNDFFVLCCTLYLIFISTFSLYKLLLSTPLPALPLLYFLPS